VLDKVDIDLNIGKGKKRNSGNGYQLDKGVYLGIWGK
jgi:hypothetical protein